MKTLFTIDSGASVNTVTPSTYQQLKNQGAKLFRCNSKKQPKLFAYSNSTPLQVVQRFTAKVFVSVEKPPCVAEFYVIAGAKRNLIGLHTSEQLRILKVGLEVDCVVTDGIGKKPFPKAKEGLIMFDINSSVIPKKAPYYRIPVGMEEKVNLKLTEMLNTDIIERTVDPSDWINPMVVVPKGKNDVRICIDMRAANRAIRRVHHPLPVIEDFLHKLKGAKVFSKIDIKNAYHHLVLHPKSRPITTFMTSKGLFRFKRLVFGVNCAPEFFQRYMETVLSGIKGCVVMLDDILVFASSVEEHDKILREVDKRLRHHNLLVNKKKCQYRVAEVDFLGFNISGKGTKPSKEKIIAVRNFRRPKTAAEVSSFLGLVNFVGSYIENLAEVAAPLREVAKEPFKWEQEQEKAFHKLKTALEEAPYRAFFDPKAETILYTDASAHGLGAVLLQLQSDSAGKLKPQIISYAAKTLTDTEKRYPQTHREALGIIWAIERFHLYLFGVKFKILTDHQALKFIFGKNGQCMKRRALNRAEGWALRAQPYDFEAIYCKGKDNIADALSRLCEQQAEAFEEEGRHFIAEISFGDETVTIQEIQDESRKDDEIQTVLKALKDDKWPEDRIQFQAFKNELHELEGMLMREDRPVIPKTLRQKILRITHLSHPSVSTTKRTLRERIWWPSMDHAIEVFAKSCLACCAVAKQDPPEELIRASLPEEAWEQIAIDFMSIPEFGSHLLVAVDYYSRYVWIKIMTITDAERTIQALEELFDIWGYPAILRSDNGPPFSGETFTRYCKAKQIIHDRTTPYSPQQNGLVERQNRGIVRSLKIAKLEHTQWRKAVRIHVNAYNRRPHSVTLKAPLALMVHRSVRDGLPNLGSAKQSLNEAWKDRDKIEKLKGKLYTDKRRQARPSNLQEKDIVMIRNRETGKLQPNFTPEPFEVVNKSGGEVLLRRHITQVKKWPIQQESESAGIDQAKHVQESEEETQVQESEEETVQVRRTERERKPNPRYLNEIFAEALDVIENGLE